MYVYAIKMQATAPTVLKVWLLACSRVTTKIIQFQPLALAAVQVSSCISLVMLCNCLDQRFPTLVTRGALFRINFYGRAP